MSGFLAARFGRVGTVLGVVLCSLLVQSAIAVAGECAPSRGSPEIARLQRQIAANRAFQVKYSCAAVSSFACREITGRIAQASTRLASLSGAQGRSCKPIVADRTQGRRSAIAATRGLATGYALPRISARMETRCVRLSDGYSFPTPNSGYNTASDVEAISAQCKFICADPAMDVYRMTSTDRNTDEMISVTTGARYAQLPNTGVYRMVASLKTCDINRFYKTVLAKMPPAADASSSNAESVQPVEALNVALLGNVGLRGTSSFVQPPARKVRVVGAAYLPDN
ncbi:DUF2865 domain-containing protein [Pararhizobium sp. DWP3-4]|uniref:DUF2865 domain-containing protein n=1 Tax=Pararhizobium sp. DWP3-4 TaxID=2804565 RepID=UPI003CF1B07E